VIGPLDVLLLPLALLLPAPLLLELEDAQEARMTAVAQATADLMIELCFTLVSPLFGASRPWVPRTGPGTSGPPHQFMRPT
jgi:hypothetical protein